MSFMNDLQNKMYLRFIDKFLLESRVLPLLGLPIWVAEIRFFKS